MKLKILALALLAASIIIFSGCTSQSYFTASKEAKTGCYKTPDSGYPYWYECNGIKVTQNVENDLREITNFTVFGQEKRVFFEYSDMKTTNFYSNNFTGNSLTLLNVKPGESETVLEFNSSKKTFMQILNEQKRAAYLLVKTDAYGNTLAQRLFTNNLFGNSSREIMQQQNAKQQSSCLNLDNNKFFWFYSKKDSNGNETKALYWNTLDGKGIKLGSYIAKPCNPYRPKTSSSEIMPFEKECSDNTFYSLGKAALWFYRDIWNNEKCDSANITEAVFASNIETGQIKRITQFARIEEGDAITAIPNGIDETGNRMIWIFDSKQTGKALYYNCLTGYGLERIIPGSEGNTSDSIMTENNTLSWEANGKKFTAQLQDCPN
jgi:hypothetical protein